MALPNETKDRIITIRASRSQLDAIDQAARVTRKSRSDFMLEAATRTAEDVMFDSNVFSMPAEEWDAYIASIESPPEPTPALRELLREPSPWN